MFDLTGRVALITGAGKGTGAAIARALAEQGAAVAVNDLTHDIASPTVAHVRESGGIAISVAADVSNREAISRMVDSVVSDLGPIDVLVNNAGVPAGGFKTAPFEGTSPADWEYYVSLNLFGVLHCTHSVIPMMTNSGWGRIVTIGSDAGRVGEPGMAAYCASKAASAGFMRSLAKEVGRDGVTCNSISLGSIQIDGDQPDDPRAVKRYPMRRLGRASDVAPAVVWLASDEAGWVTGQTISINGGYMTT